MNDTEDGYGTSETFLLRRVRRGDNIPAGGCVAKTFGLLQNHVLFGAVVVLAVDGEGRGVSLGKYGGVVPNETCLSHTRPCRVPLKMLSRTIP